MRLRLISARDPKFRLALAKVRHTPDALAEEVAVALLQMPADHLQQGSRLRGPDHLPEFRSVHDCLKALKVGPYKDLGQIAFTDVLHSYGHGSFLPVRPFPYWPLSPAGPETNRRIKTSHVRLQVEMDLHKQKDRKSKQAKELPKPPPGPRVSSWPI